MEKVVCYTSSSSEKGERVYLYSDGRKIDPVTYSYKDASNLYFLIIEDKEMLNRSLVLLERRGENEFSTKHGYDMNAYLVPRDADSNVFETSDNAVNILQSFPFEDIDDINCGRHYKDDEIGAIYNVMNSLISANYNQDALSYVKGRVLFKNKNN